MSRFSELLSIHIQNSGKNKVQIAGAIGMPRTNLQKISTGSRRPTDEQTVEKIMNELILSVKDREELWEAYFNDAIGSNVYGEYRECVQLLNAFYLTAETLPSAYDGFIEESLPKEIMKFQSHFELIQTIQMICQQKMDVNKDKVCLLLQPDKSLLLHQLLSMIRKFSTISMEHVICFDHHNELNIGYAQKNLKKMRNIIDFMLVSNNYQAYYYYDYSDIHFGTTSLFPNIILIGKYLICFDEMETKGFVTTNKDLYDMYYDRFLHIKNYSTSLFDRCNFTIYEAFAVKKRYYIVYQPLLHLKKADQDVMFLTKDGLLHYVKETKKKEKDEVIQRYDTLKILKEQMVTYGNIFVIKDINLILDKKGTFVLESSHQYVFYKMNEDGSSVRIKEQSVLNAMHKFLLYLPNSVMCLPKEESIMYMIYVIQEFRIQYPWIKEF